MTTTMVNESYMTTTMVNESNFHYMVHVCTFFFCISLLILFDNRYLQNLILKQL